MNVNTKETIEAGAVLLALVAVAFLMFRRSNSPALDASADPSNSNVAIAHTGEAGSEYYNYNYPMIQGMPWQTSVTYDNSPCGATCGCSETSLLGSNADFQRYLQTRLSGFIDSYVENVMSFLPTWYTQYLEIVGPDMSNLPAVEL